MLQQTKSPGEDAKRDLLRQVNIMWKWLKEQPIPEVSQDGYDPVWADMWNSARAVVENNEGDFLRYLMNACVDYIQDDWKTRKKKEETNT